jgi:HD-like signal output (HDOD) protein
MPISVTAQEKEILTKVNIPPRPQALMKISQEAKQPEPNIKIIADAIAEDAAIASAVLQVVNSAAFRRAKKIESIHQAVMTLGIKRIFPLVKAVAIKSALPENKDLLEFWKSSSMVASACSLYSELINKPELSDNAYMLGLFHNAGVPMMLQSFDDYHDVLIKGITDGWEDISELERNKFHTSHTTLGALLAQKWQLPKAMIDVIYYFHDTEGIFNSGELSPVGLYLMSILKLARSSVDGILRGDSNTKEWLLLEDRILEFLDIDEVQLEYMREEVVNALDKEVD